MMNKKPGIGGKQFNGNRPPSTNNRVVMNAATVQKIGMGNVGGPGGVGTSGGITGGMTITNQAL